MRRIWRFAIIPHRRPKITKEECERCGFFRTGKKARRTGGTGKVKDRQTMKEKVVYSKLLIIGAAALCTTATFGASVWEDAILWFNGAADLNNDGMWTGNVQSRGSGLWSQCNGYSVGCELPDARHGALAYSASQAVSYVSDNQTVCENSGFQIRTNDVHFTAWGNKTVKWPCLYLPQTPSGNPDAPYAQSMDLFADGGCPITGNNWSVLVRCRIEDCYRYNWGGAWLLGVITTDLGGARELRIGFTQGGWTEDYSSPYYLGALPSSTWHAGTDSFVFSSLTNP